MKYLNWNVMNRIYKIVFAGVFLVTLFSPCAEAQHKPLPDENTFRQKLEEMAATTQSIKSDFKQEKHLSILSNALISEGELIFKKPNLLKWAYEKPFQYVIVLDGKEIKMKDEEKTSTFDITSSKTFKQINDLIVSSVNGDILKEDQFDITYFQDEKNYIAFLVPKDAQMKKFVSKIELFFDKNDLTVNRLILREPNDDYTLINFSEKKINSNITDEAFRIH